MDCFIDEKALTWVADNPIVYGKQYFFNRGGKPHPNVFAVHRQALIDCPYDEDFAGNYAWEDILMHHRFEHAMCPVGECTGTGNNDKTAVRDSSVNRMLYYAKKDQMEVGQCHRYPWQIDWYEI